MTKPITLFSWGYDGWGNGPTQLVRAVDEGERKHGFKPPMFVDVRFQRAACPFPDQLSCV